MFKTHQLRKHTNFKKKHLFSKKTANT